MADIQENPPHFVLFPFMAQGNMIPMVDISRLVAKQGVIITILITPYNHNRFKTVITRAIDSGLDIRVFHLRLPCVEAGLPEEYQNFDMLPSFDYAVDFFRATSLLEDQVLEFLQEVKPKPSCLLSDMCYPWTTNVAVRLGIPRILFHGTSCFSLICHLIIGTSKDLDAMAPRKYFVVPDLPDRIEITKAQLRGTADEIPEALVKIQEEFKEAEKEAFGTVANTFQELEPEYVKKYSTMKGQRLWCIGPVSLCNKDELDKAERGNKAAINEQDCLKWLDSQESSSVLYVCLGSLSQVAAAQLIQLGLGLETSNRPFIWVIRNPSDEFKKWLLEENFEERINKRGLLIHGWAPQVLILSHPSVGAFLTHCGWNSTLEGITSGLAMITWPVFAEQFCNEKFVVNVIKTGVRVGVEEPVRFGEEEKVGVQVKSDDIKVAIDELMDGGEEGRERRKRARKLGEMAKRAVEEGGSSYINMKMLIEDIKLQAEKNDGKLVGENENSSEIAVQ